MAPCGFSNYGHLLSGFRMNHALGQLYPFDVEHLVWVLTPVYGAEASLVRAEHILTDIKRIGVRPQLRALKLDEMHHVAFYTFGKSNFALGNTAESDTLRVVGFRCACCTPGNRVKRLLGHCPHSWLNRTRESTRRMV